MRRCQRRLEETRDAERQSLGVRLRQVGQYDDSKIEIGITLNRGLEATPGAGVSDTPMAALLGEVPTEAIRVSAITVQLDRCPAPTPARPGSVPFHHSGRSPIVPDPGH